MASRERRGGAGAGNHAFLYVHEENARALAVYTAAGYRPDGSDRVSDFRGTPVRELRLLNDLSRTNRGKEFMADTPSKVLLRSEETGGQLAVVELGGGARPPLHRHDFDETFYILEGEVTLPAWRRLFTRRAGDSPCIDAPALNDDDADGVPDDAERVGAAVVGRQSTVTATQSVAYTGTAFDRNSQTIPTWSGGLFGGPAGNSNAALPLPAWFVVSVAVGNDRSGAPAQS